MTAKRHLSPYSRQATLLLGQQIRLYRKKKRWTEAETAGRAGISRATLRKIEQGDATCSIGLFFEVAYLVGIELFASDAGQLNRHLEMVHDKLLLLPASVRQKGLKVDDDF